MIGRRGRRLRKARSPRVAGISMVRDEVDLVRISVLHHLSLGLEEILVADNGSTDGTGRLLADLARRHPVQWTRDDSAYRQGEIMTGLAREAHARGASWVLPFDADELWYAARPLQELLAKAQAVALECQVRTYVQARAERTSRPGSLLSMTRRVAAPSGAYEDARRRVEAAEIAFVEMPYPPKVVARTAPTIELAPGSHAAGGLEGAAVASSAMVCLHAPLRSRATLDRKAEGGRRSDAAGLHPEINWHLRRWSRLADEGRLDDEWRANSYAEDGALDIGSRRVGLVEDRALANLAARFV